MTRIAIVKQSLRILTGLFFAVVFSACDQNIAPPEALADQSESISIAFSATPTDIVTGETVRLSWTVSDDEDAIESVTIEPGLGARPQSGSATVAPKKDTTYTLTVVRKGGTSRARALTIRVFRINAEGNLEPIPEDTVLVETPTAESDCTDNLDEDKDNETDCDDSDCNAAPECAEAILAFASVTIPQDPIIGETVEISWDSNFSFVTIYANDETTDVPGGVGSVTFEALENNTVVLQGYNESGALVDVYRAPFAALPVHVDEFSAVLDDFSLTPSGLLYAGQPYEVSWTVSNANQVSMDGVSGISGTEEKIAVVGVRHQLDIVDTKDIAQSYTLTPTVAAFDGLESRFGADIVDTASSRGKAPYVYVTAEKIFKTDDGLNFQEVPKTGINGTITGVDVSADVLVVTTTRGAYILPTDAAAFIVLQTSATRNVEFRDAHITANGDIILGLNSSLYKAEKCDGDCSEFRQLVGYHAAKVLPFGDRTTITDYNNQPLNVIRFVGAEQTADHLFMIAEGGAAFESSDAGSTFSPVTSAGTGLTSGSCEEPRKCFLWSPSQAFMRDYPATEFSPVIGTSGMVNIRAVAYTRGLIFVAHSQGVSAAGANPFRLNLTAPIASLRRIQVAEGAEFDSYQVLAVTLTGQTATLMIPKSVGLTQPVMVTTE